MKLRPAILALGAANAVLAGVCGLLLSRHHRESTVGELVAKGVSGERDDRVSSSHTTSSSQAPADPFSYLKVFSRDWKKYIANLKAVQCPEETINDILLAEINRFYSNKEAGLKLRPTQRDPWETLPSGGRRDWGKYEQLRFLENERVATIKELLGLDVPPNLPPLISGSGNEAFESALAVLPEAKRAAVQTAQEEFWTKAQKLQEKVNGLYLPADAEEYRKLRSDRLSALKKVLTPEEFDQFERKTSPASGTLANRLAYFSASAEEERTLFTLQHDYYEDHTLPGQVVGDKGVTNQRDGEAQAALDKQIAQSLGPERYAEYQRSQDGTFRQIAKATEGAGVSRDIAIQVYDTTQQVRQDMLQIGSDPNLTPQQRQEQLQMLMSATADQVRQAVGDKAWAAIQGTLPQYRPPVPKSNQPNQFAAPLIF